MRKKTLFGTFILLLLAIAPAAQAGVLYYDNFDGPAGVDLQNTTPDISVGGAMWQAGAWVNADGTYGGGAAGQMFTAALPFTPIIGAAYELSAVVDNQGDWVGIAFMNAAPGVGTRLNDNAPLLWALTRPSGATTKDQAFVGPGASTATNMNAASTTTSAAELKVRIEMNSATNWLVTWYFDGSQQFQRSINPTGTPSIVINYVAFGGNGLFSALTGTIKSFKLVEIPQALKPNPTNGSLAYSTTVTLQWQPGIYAANNDVYFGESFADVNNATTSTPVIYKGRKDPNNYTVTGLTPGKTYYWRIDGVDNNGTIDRGEVWNFKVQPLIAYNPSPPEGAKYLDPDTNLTWTQGSKAKLHDVYLGTSLNDVSNASRNNSLSVLLKQNHDANSYDPGTLALGTDYYWRIDEVNTPNNWKGDVWRFTTMPLISITNPTLVGWWKFDEGQGLRALDWSGHGNHGTLVDGPQWSAGQLDGALQFDGINDTVSLPIGSVNSQLTDSTFAVWVNWGRFGAPTQRVFDFGNGADVYMYLSPGSGGGGAIQFSITTSGGTAQSQLTAPFALAAGWHHLAVVIDGATKNMELYLDGDVVVSGLTPTLAKDLGNTTQNWLGRSQAGDYTWFIGSLDDFRIYNRPLTQTDIERVMTGDPALASNPRPANGAAADIEHAKPLSWLPGENAVQHDVYFGIDANAVGNADISDTTGLYRGRQDPNTYTSPEELKINQTYYWRIDEFNTNATISKGKVWSFTISEYLIVDDFEDYGDVENIIYEVWVDCVVNNTGMTVGHFDPPFAERSIVHDGFQSMYMRYDNDGSVNEGYGPPIEIVGTLTFSEAQREWSEPQDWTRKGINSLTLWFRGVPASVGSFTVGPPIKMTAGGVDIWGTADQLHFAYKQLSGPGSITAKVVSVSLTDSWAKAGVMIRESLEAGSANAMVVVTPGNGVVFQRRPSLGAASEQVAQQAGIVAPQWVKLTRSGNTFTAEYSANGTPPWTTLGSVDMPMLADVYVGLCLTSHTINATCTAEFSNVANPGTGDWKSQDIGIESNVPEQLYVLLQDAAGNSAVVKHPDPASSAIGTWTPWDIPLTIFTGINLQTIKKLSIGVGDRDNPQRGGSGVLYIDDIRLYLP